MAEGGNSEVKNNLSENQQEKKTMPTKEITQDKRDNRGENSQDKQDNREVLAMAELSQPGYICSYVDRNCYTSPEHRAYTAESSTAYKAALGAGPSLTPENSPKSSLETDPSPCCNGASNDIWKDSRNGEAACEREELEKALPDSSGFSDVSRGCMEKDNFPPSASVSSSASEEGARSGKLTNNLNSESSAQSQPAAAPRAFSNTLPQNIVYVPMSFVPSGGQPIVGMMPVPLSVNGGPGVMMSAPPNISSPTAVNLDVRSATMGVSYMPSTTYDSRIIPPVRRDCAPSSGEDNNSNGTRSYSLNPSGSSNLKRLRKPVLDWIRKKLDVGTGNNWEALADIHGWRYDDIRYHLHDCRHRGTSPFLELLDTDTFLEYNVDDFLADMKNIRRYDILREFDSVLQQANDSA